MHKTARISLRSMNISHSSRDTLRRTVRGPAFGRAGMERTGKPRECQLNNPALNSKVNIS